MLKEFKTATITFHAPENCGAFLQAYALQYYIEHVLSLPNDIINYRSEAQKKEYDLFHTQTGVRGLFRDFCSCIRLSDLKKRKKQYKILQEKYLKCTQECKDTNEVIKQALEYNVLICGSDQIWNDRLRDASTAYYLPGLRNKISYACSMGSDISEGTKSNLEKYLKEFSAISVREKGAAAFIRKEYCQEAACCVDPTLLIGKEVYEQIICNEKRSTPEKYIFLYTVKCQEYILKIAQSLSKQFDLPVYSIMSTPSVYAGFRAQRYGIRVLYSGDPADFLSYIREASFVLSDSFHGIVFSVIFHKSFLRGQSVHNGKLVQDERIDSFLYNVGLDDRNIFYDKEGSNPFNKVSIDWDLVDKKLTKLSEESGEWLKKSIENLCRNEKEVAIPQLVRDKHGCCGCGACSAACPTYSVLMISDNEGFSYPVVNPYTCIGCNACISACRFNQDQQSKGLS